MKLKFYSFHDALTNGYSQPFLQNNRAQAVTIGTMESQRKQTK